MTEPTIVARSVEKTNVWLDELATELGTDDRKAAYGVLRGFLHALRDRLTVEESAQLAGQLPELIRGIYYEGWRPSRTPERCGDIDSFLEQVGHEAPLHGETEASYAAAAAARVLRRHASNGEIEDVLATLPASFRPILPRIPSRKREESNVTDVNEGLKARPGDRLVVRGHHLGEPDRDGEILEVLGQDGGPPYRVLWDDGHTSEVFPGSDSYVQHFQHD